MTVFSAQSYQVCFEPLAGPLLSVVLICKIVIINFSIGHGYGTAFTSGDANVKTQRNAR